jgi:hypothetical protein
MPPNARVPPGAPCLLFLRPNYYFFCTAPTRESGGARSCRCRPGRRAATWPSQLGAPPARRGGMPPNADARCLPVPCASCSCARARLDLSSRSRARHPLYAAPWPGWLVPCPRPAEKILELRSVVFNFLQKNKQKLRGNDPKNVREETNGRTSAQFRVQSAQHAAPRTRGAADNN